MLHYQYQFSRSVVSNSVAPWTAVCQASLSITNCWSLPKPMSIELVMPSNHLILCRLLLHPPSIFPSIRVFSNESALCIRWPKYWSAYTVVKVGTSLVVQWIVIICQQGTCPLSVIWEDATQDGATKPLHHNYWHSRAYTQQQEKPQQREVRTHSKTKSRPRLLQLEKTQGGTKTQAQPKIHK